LDLAAEQRRNGLSSTSTTERKEPMGMGTALMPFIRVVRSLVLRVLLPIEGVRLTLLVIEELAEAKNK